MRGPLPPHAELEAKAMDAILVILLFVGAFAALNYYEFGRLD